MTKIIFCVIIYNDEEEILGGNFMGASSYSSYSGKEAQIQVEIQVQIEDLLEKKEVNHQM